jgi:hypothetical protein
VGRWGRDLLELRPQLSGGEEVERGLGQEGGAVGEGEAGLDVVEERDL